MMKILSFKVLLLSMGLIFLLNTFNSMYKDRMEKVEIKESKKSSEEKESEISLDELTDIILEENNFLVIFSKPIYFKKSPILKASKDFLTSFVGLVDVPPPDRFN